MKNIKQYMKELTNKQLIDSYSILLETLKGRKIIRTNNLVGDLGETYAIEFFNTRKTLPNLVQSEPNEKSYDAKTNKNKKYSIKSTSTTTTGNFRGLEPKGSIKRNRKIFDFALVVKFNKSYVVESIYQIDWNNFIKLKNWSETNKGWRLILNKEFLKEAKQLL